MAPTATLLLVHSPLVGPSIWATMGALVRERSRHVVVADATAAVSTARVASFIEAVMTDAAGIEGPIVVVGHSGAGVFLPRIAARLGGRLQSIVFVDAPLPPETGHHITDDGLRSLLDANSVDGVLSRWLDWWPAGLVEAMLPDRALRASLRADMPQVLRALYDEPLPVPPGWSQWPCGYLLLSEAYRQHYDEAGGRGWPRIELDGTHLSVVTDADTVLEAIEWLVAALRDA